MRALVRPRSDRNVLSRQPLTEFATGAIEAPDTLATAMDGVEAVVHVAGIVKARSTAEFFQVNTQGTKNLLEAALKRGGIRRFVYVSSLAAFGPSPDGKPLLDDAQPRPLSPYGRSKLEAEQAVLAAKDRLHVTVIRPPAIYGPRDRETLAFYTSVKRHVLPVLGKGEMTLSMVYGDDAARACVRALTAEVPSGRAYFIDDGVFYTLRDLIGGIEQAMERRAWLRLPLPWPVVTSVAAATQLWGKVTGTAQMLTLDKVRELKQPYWICSGEGARRELGWAPRVQWAQGVQEAVKWYRAEGWL